MLRIRMILAISRHLSLPPPPRSPGLAVDGVAPPTLLPWLLLCGRSSAVYWTVSAAIGLGKIKGTSLWVGEGTNQHRGKDGLWDHTEGIDRSIVLPLVSWDLLCGACK